jgi:hypothetical protein
MKNFLVLIFLIISSLIYAQDNCKIIEYNAEYEISQAKFQNSPNKETMIIYPGNWQQVNAVTTYKYDGCVQLGWVFGNNIYHVIGSGVKFTAPTQHEIIGAYFWFGSIAEGNNNITFSVYEFIDNKPGEILASKIISQNDVFSLSTYNALPSDFVNSFYLEFDESVIVSGDYFLGFDVSELGWEQAGDGAGLVSGMIGQGGGGADIAYILSKEEGWQTAQEWDYQLNLDLAIFPVVAREIINHQVTFVLNTESACFYDNILFNPEIHNIYISGTFNDWTVPGSNDDYKLQQSSKNIITVAKENYKKSNNQYSLTLEIPEGEHEYKYFLVIDEPTWEHEEWEGSPNRQFSANQDLLLEDVANSDCSINITDIKENNSSIFPNPTKDVIRISSASLIKHIKIISIEGRLIKNLEINSNNTIVDLEPYKNGMYILQATTEEGTQSFKIFKVE